MRRRSITRNQSRRRPAATDPVREQSLTHTPNPFRFYRVSRLAELFDVDRVTIWRWKKAGILPPFATFGGIAGLTESQLEDAIARRQQRAPSASRGR